MQIQCECGSFRAKLTTFPKNTPGRLICYCDDCQAFLHYLKRDDLLDQNGGTEIVPAYPADIELVAGKEHIKCVRLSPTGMYRFYAGCCSTPIGNTDPVRAWVGIPHRAYSVKEPHLLEKMLGPIKSSIMGKHAKGTPPPGTPQTFDLKCFATVMPFILKGILKKKAKPSPFFENGISVVAPKILTREERAIL
jgi:hypothetical protein